MDNKPKNGVFNLKKQKDNSTRIDSKSPEPKKVEPANKDKDCNCGRS